jgi:hypothetical protein
MKKIINYLGIIAASAFVFSSCQKELAEVNFVTVSFTAEKVNTESKTAVVEGGSFASYEWTAEDVANIKLFTVEAGNLKAEVASPTITKNSATSLTISTTVPENSTTTFRAILCKPANYTGSGDDYTSRKPKVAGTQAPNGMAGYDPEADILVSDDLDVTVGSGEYTTGAMNMVFRRQVVINKMTLKNMVEGEKVSKVIITSDKHLTGYLNGGTMTGQLTTITLNYDDVAVPAGGQFPVYFVTMENSGQMLSVEVTTDKYIYSKAFGSSIDLNLGEFTRFGVGLPAGTPNSVLTLPFDDDFSWQTGSVTTAPTSLYSDYSTIYTDRGANAIRLGKDGTLGYITTNRINLNSAFYVHVNAAAYNNSDNTKITVTVDDGSPILPMNSDDNMTTTAADYYFNCVAATSASKVKVSVTTGTTKTRFVLYDLEIISGTYVLPPSISVTSDNPMELANTSSSQTITYYIDNPTGASLTAALQDPSDTWISNIVYSTPGEVTFDVAAQDNGDPARSAVIVLSYTDASDVEVTVNQAAGQGAGPSLKTLYLETFGDNGSSNTVVASATCYTATTSMFTDPENTVVSHYLSDGKVGKNSVNPSDTYSGASGNSAVWYTGAGKTTTTANLFTVEKIDISSATGISVSFGLFHTNAAGTTVTAYYTIDDGVEQSLSFSEPSSNNTWTLCTGTIVGTGSSLKLRFQQETTGGYTGRIDDIKVVGTK